MVGKPRQSLAELRVVALQLGRWSARTSTFRPAGQQLRGPAFASSVAAQDEHLVQHDIVQHLQARAAQVDDMHRAVLS